MKCSGCGAEIPESAKFCEYCGSQISYEMRREQEQINMAGCPKCHSSNIQFRRENQGEVRGKQSKRVIHRTVGFCKDCGYTWYPDTAAGVANDTNQKSNMKWWVLGWIFFFPAPAMVLIWRKKNTWNAKVKIGVTIAFWIVFFLLYLYGKNNPDSYQNRQATTIQSTSQYDTLAEEEEESAEDLKTYYEDDEGINRYINYFNEANPDSPITSEMAKPYYHHGSDHKNQINYYTDGFEITITDGDKVYIGYTQSTDHTKDEYKEMFVKYVKGFNLELSDAEIESDWDGVMRDLTNSVDFEKYSVDVRMYNDKIEYMTISKRRY